MGPSTPEFPVQKYVAQARVLHEAQVRLIVTIAANQEAERKAEEARAASRRQQSQSSGSSGSSVVITGDCASMKPPGFPDYIIQRESGGNPNARNPSGAYGCAQLMVNTGDQKADWARLWNNGAGACNWNPPNYCGG